MPWFACLVMLSRLLTSLTNSVWPESLSTLLTCLVSELFSLLSLKLAISHAWLRSGDHRPRTSKVGLLANVSTQWTLLLEVGLHSTFHLDWTIKSSIISSQEFLMIITQDLHPNSKRFAKSMEFTTGVSHLFLSPCGCSSKPWLISRRESQLISLSRRWSQKLPEWTLNRINSWTYLPHSRITLIHTSRVNI